MIFRFSNKKSGGHTMTRINLTLNNFSDFEAFLPLFPASNDYIFTEKKVFKSTKYIFCSCGTKMVDNGFDFIRKKGFGKVKVGKKICQNCKIQHHEDKSFFKDLLSKWLKKIAIFATILRDNDVSWQGTSDIMNFIMPCSKDKMKYLFDKEIEQFEYEQDNFLIVNYDEQHPKKGRSQKYRLTLINYQTKNVIADQLFDNKEEKTIELFLRNNLDTTKKLVVITDCDRRYPKIFKSIWKNKLIHQKCLMHLNKLVSKDFGSKINLQNMYNKYLILNIFYNRERELNYLKTLLKKSSNQNFNWDEERKKFFDFVRIGEKRRRRKGKNLVQRKLWKAKELFEICLNQINLFPKKAQERLIMIRKNWKYLTAFYKIKNCPATNNEVENFYSTSIKTHRKKQFRTDKGLINQMKIAAKKRKEGLIKPTETFLQLFYLIKFLVT
jgi:hypothetical protein